MHEQGKSADAEAGYRKALSLNSRHTSALVNLGSLLAGRGEVDEAVSLLEEAIRLLPGNPKAHLGLGSALGMKGDWDRAAEHLRRTIELAPQDVSAYRLLGGVLESAGKLREAEEVLRTALPMLTTRDGATLAALIRVLMRQGKDEEAGILVERTLRTPPGSLRNHALNLANLLNLTP